MAPITISSTTRQSSPHHYLHRCWGRRGSYSHQLEMWHSGSPHIAPEGPCRSALRAKPSPQSLIFSQILTLLPRKQHFLEKSTLGFTLLQRKHSFFTKRTQDAILLKQKIKKVKFFHHLDLHLPNVLVWLYYAALQFFTPHQSPGDVCSLFLKCFGRWCLFQNASRKQKNTRVIWALAYLQSAWWSAVVGRS